MRALWCLVLVAGVAVAGCSSESRSPDAIRNDTAHVTAGVARDAKAVAQGVVDGLRQKGPVNINKGSREQLETLPGVSGEVADRIIAGRPYESGGDLVKKRVVSKAEYGQIADKVVAR
jgi:DNA uptake protein ComE-like DNA-binding protein